MKFIITQAPDFSKYAPKETETDTIKKDYETPSLGGGDLSDFQYTFPGEANIKPTTPILQMIDEIHDDNAHLYNINRLQLYTDVDGEPPKHEYADVWLLANTKE